MWSLRQVFFQTLSLFIKKYLRVSIPIQVDQSDRRRDEGSLVSHEHNAQECQFAGERIKLFQYLVQKRNVHEYCVDLKKGQILGFFCKIHLLYIFHSCPLLCAPIRLEFQSWFTQTLSPSTADQTQGFPDINPYPQHLKTWKSIFKTFFVF